MTLIKSLPNHLRISIIMLFMSVSVMYAPLLIESILGKAAHFEKIRDNVYLANLKDVAPGSYILSLGKTRAICNLSTNNRSIYQHNGPIGVKKNISDDLSFRIDSFDQSLTLDCSQALKGFPPRLTHNPVLLSYSQGRILEVTRYFVDVIFGSFAAGFLVIMVAYLTASNGKLMVGLLLLACSAAFYSLNQAYFFRTFLEGDINSWLHPISKTFFTWLLYKTLAEEWKLKWHDLIIQAVPVIALTFVYSDQVLINYVYKGCHILWFSLFAHLYYRSYKTSRSELSKALILLWAFALALDVSTLTNAFGPYFAPVFFALLVFGLTLESGSIARRTAKLYAASQDLAKAATNMELSPISAVGAFASELTHISGFVGYSVYFDSAFLGGTDKYRHLLKRTDSGGQYTSNAPEVLDIFEGQGRSIVTALETKNFVFQQGSRDKAWYAVIPIGSNAVICLTSSPNAAKPDHAYFSSLISAISTAIQSLDIRLQELATNLNSSLARLKKNYKNGSYHITSGALFIDIADYSKHCETYGTGYAEFISSTFFPAMLRNMEGLATPESVRGDEIYFVIANELTESNQDIHIATTNAVLHLHRFMTKEANQIASENGFANIEYRIGVTVGEGNLVIDDVQVRTSGEHINRAKRLQEAASKGEILADIAIVNSSNDKLFSITKKSIIVKKNQIEAARVGIKRAA